MFRSTLRILLRSKLQEISTNQAFGGIDILVNNAGIAGPNANLWDYPPEAWREVIDVDLNAVFYCCRAVVPQMIEQNYGRICSTASIAGKEGNPTASPYAAAKAGRDRADQSARQGVGHLRHCGQLHHAGGRQDPDL